MNSEKLRTVFVEFVILLIDHFFSKNIDYEVISIKFNRCVFWEKKNTDLSSWYYHRCLNAPMIAFDGKGRIRESH